MPQTYTSNVYMLRIRRMPPWQVAIILAGASAVAVALALLAGGLFLILLPVVLVGAVAYRFRGLRRASFPRRDPDIIEGEYVVVSDGPADDKASPLNERLRDT